MAADSSTKAPSLPRPAGRILPHNVQAEQSVLGSAMSGERQLAEITALLKTDDFYRPDHRLVYDAICELYLASKPVDILTVSDLLESKSLLEKALNHLSAWDAIFRAMAQTDLAEIALAQGDLPEARRRLELAYEPTNQLIRRLLVFLCALAGYLVLSGRDKASLIRAAQFYGAVEALASKSGINFNSFYRNLNEGRMRAAREKLSAGEWREAYESGRGWERNEVVQRAQAELAR